MSKFYPLVVREVVHETPSAVSLKFVNPDPSVFAYLPGQYLTLKVPVDGEVLRRAFSLSSAPGLDPDLQVTVKCVEGGRASQFLKKNARAGQTYEAFPPLGKFVANIQPKESRHFVLVGAGSGVTPLFSILKSVLHFEPRSRVCFIYGNRNREETIFNDELEQLKLNFVERFKLVHVMSRPMPGDEPDRVGRIEGKLARELLQDELGNAEDALVYMCGPEAMMQSVQNVLRELDFPQSRVFREYYSAPLPQETEETRQEQEYEIVDRTVEVVLEGKKYSVFVKAGVNILQAVIDKGLDPPFACQEGVCATCRAHVDSGLVQMMERDGLSDEEIMAGYVLTCQSYPLTEDVRLEYC
ncbi:MAG: ferredoxin--NADP reductase [Bacteroidia bacterium]|nr:ferredoxin--NADP reductase [Bacteroidia bacterium]MDW8333709.1 ferredoxin--NADP reductase [Bacteroidia bacterium]